MVSDAHGTDPGGNEVGVLLFIEDGYLSEVEVYSTTGDGFAGLPDADALEAQYVERHLRKGVVSTRVDEDPVQQRDALRDVARPPASRSA